MSQRATRSSLVALLLALPLSASAGSLQLQTLSQPAPVRMARMEPTATQASATKVTASQTLGLSAAALASKTSYSYAGSSTVTTGKVAKPVSLSGGWQSPSTSYSKGAQSSSKGSSAFETYVDASAVYVRGSTSGAATPDQWVKTNQKPAAQGNPFATLQAVSKGSKSVTYGADATVNGKACSSVVVTLTEEQAKALLSTVTAAAGVTPSGSVTSKASGSITYFIDKTTYLSEKASFKGSQTVTSSGKSSSMTVAGELTLSGINQPVTLPDVSSAVSVAR